MNAGDSPNQGPASISRHRPFLLFWFARVFSSSALQMQTVAVGWQVYALTQSPLDLGLVGLAQFLPAFLLVLVVGHVADRYSRGAVVRISQIVESAVAATLAIGTATGWLSRDHILALVVVLGAARAFEAPSLQSLLPNIVPLPLLPRATAGSASANQTATIVGPALGGILYAVNPILVYAICCVLFFAAAILISFVRTEREMPKREQVDTSTLFAGIAFIRRSPVILGAISLDLFAVLLGGATALLPVYARDIFQTGPWALGFLRASTAAGALCMAIALAHWPLKRHVGTKMFAAVILFGIATIVFALSRNYTLSLVALFILGATDMISVVIRTTVVQLQTPDAMRGRVAAVNALFIGTSNQLGEFESGVTAALFGTVPSVVIGGAGTILVVLLWMKFFPDLRNADSFETMKSR